MITKAPYSSSILDYLSFEFIAFRDLFKTPKFLSSFNHVTAYFQKTWQFMEIFILSLLYS